MSHDINEDLQRILKEVEADVPRIREYEFKKYLLPLIASTDEKNLDVESIWLQFSGDWRRPIDVMADDLTSDEVETATPLFRVPALVAGIDTPFKQSSHNSTYELIRNAQRKMQIVPKAGEEALVRGLSERIKPAGDRDEHIRQWAAIYKRYNLTHLLTKDDQVESGIQSDTKGAFDGYDEL